MEISENLVLEDSTANTMLVCVTEKEKKRLCIFACGTMCTRRGLFPSSGILLTHPSDRATPRDSRPIPPTCRGGDEVKSEVTWSTLLPHCKELREFRRSFSFQNTHATGRGAHSVAVWTLQRSGGLGVCTVRTMTGAVGSRFCLFSD